MTNYEFMIIIDPRISEDNKNESISNIKNIFNKYLVKIENEEIWWDKKLAYNINWTTRWYYILYKLLLDWKNIKNISKDLNLDRNLMRYMFIKQES